MRIFSEFWMLSVGDNSPKKNKKNINGVGKALHAFISKWGIKRNRYVKA